MNIMGKELLVKMAEKYDETKDSSLYFTDYMSFPGTVIDELNRNGYIVKQNDIVGTIALTQLGYDEAKK